MPRAAATRPAPPAPETEAPRGVDILRDTNRDMAQRMRFGGFFYLVGVTGVVALSPRLIAQPAVWGGFALVFAGLVAGRIALAARTAAGRDHDPKRTEREIGAVYLGSALAWCAFLVWTLASIRRLDGAAAVAVIATVGITSGGIATAVPRLRLLVAYALIVCPVGLVGLPLFVPGESSWVLLAFALAFFMFSVRSGQLQHQAHWDALRQTWQLEQQALDLKQSRREAEIASTAKSAFLTSMSHELRTPMNAILGFSELLLLEALPPRQRAAAGSIHRAGQHLLALIDDLLDLSRIEAGRLTVERAPVRVDAVLREALGYVEPLLQARRIRVVDALPGGACVLADPTRLRQVLVNLLSNAAKYNRDDGRVVVDAVASEGRLRLRVADTGRGIAPAQIGKLFNIFERLGAEDSGVDGMGVGLALSHQLTALMGGKLGVESRLGEGSTFWIDLPVAEEAKEPAADRPPPPQAAGFGVLYLAQDRQNLKHVKGLFTAHPDWQLRTETSASNGFERALEAGPRAILLDLQRADTETPALLASLRARAGTSSIPVLLLAAHAAADDPPPPRLEGSRATLQLPEDLRRLSELLSMLAAESTPGPGTQEPDRRSA
ncbi:MAG: hypothetical protein KGL43_03170 [Burkholderiales bacterium]|nr:hypothetical protein [Burkholderiales bacterium]MDE2452572.1 hypothetical protein [Burkholderiales bacterium]